MPVTHVLVDTWMLTVKLITVLSQFTNFKMCLMTWNALHPHKGNHLHSLVMHNWQYLVLELPYCSFICTCLPPIFTPVHQRWSEYNTNILEYEYDYFEHAWVRVQVRVLRKQMCTSTITLQCTRVRVRLLYNVIMITFTITLECNHDYFHDYFNKYPVSTVKATSMESGVILCLLLCQYLVF